MLRLGATARSGVLSMNKGIVVVETKLPRHTRRRQAPARECVKWGDAERFERVPETTPTFTHVTTTTTTLCLTVPSGYCRQCQESVFGQWNNGLRNQVFVVFGEGHLVIIMFINLYFLSVRAVFRNLRNAGTSKHFWKNQESGFLVCGALIGWNNLKLFFSANQRVAD